MKFLATIVLAAATAAATVAPIQERDTCRFPSESCNDSFPDPAFKCCEGSTCVTKPGAAPGSYGTCSDPGAPVAARDTCRYPGETCNDSFPDKSFKCCEGSTCNTAADGPPGSYGTCSNPQ